MPALLPIAGLRKSASGDKALAYADTEMMTPNSYMSTLAGLLTTSKREYNYYEALILNSKGLIYPIDANFNSGIRINNKDLSTEIINYNINMDNTNNCPHIVNKGDKAYVFGTYFNKIFEFIDGGDSCHELNTSPFSLASTIVWGFDGNDDLSQYLISCDNNYYEKYNNSTFTHTPAKKFLDVYYSNGMYLLSNYKSRFPSISNNAYIIYDHNFQQSYINGNTSSYPDQFLCLHEANTTTFTDITLPFYCPFSTVIKYDWPKCIIGPVIKRDEYRLYTTSGPEEPIPIYIAFTEDGFNTFIYKPMPVTITTYGQCFRYLKARNWLFAGGGKCFIIVDLHGRIFYYTDDEFQTMTRCPIALLPNSNPDVPGFIVGIESDVYYYTKALTNIRHFKFR
jgi:hypothetical protein